MSIFTALIVIVLAGVLLWLVNSYIVMNRNIKTIINVVIAIILIGWLIYEFGLSNNLSNMHL